MSFLRRGNKKQAGQKTKVGAILKKVASAPVQVAKKVVGGRSAQPEVSPLKKKKGKPVTEMSDSEFEAFAKNFDDQTYWELQAQRGVYPNNDVASDGYEDYEEDY